MLQLTPSNTLCVRSNHLQLGSDKDWSLVFAVFDENKSWYMKENIHNQTVTGCNDTDADVCDSNVIYSKFTSGTTSSVLVRQITSTVTVFTIHNWIVTNLVKKEELVNNSAVYQQRAVDLLLSILLSINQDSHLHAAPSIFSSRCERHHVPQASVCHLSDGRCLLARRQRGRPERVPFRLLHGEPLSASGGLPISPHALPHEWHDRLHGAWGYR